jgi:hypothetical protein
MWLVSLRRASEYTVHRNVQGVTPITPETRESLNINNLYTFPELLIEEMTRFLMQIIGNLTCRLSTA